MVGRKVRNAGRPASAAQSINMAKDESIIDIVRQLQLDLKASDAISSAWSRVQQG